MCVCLSVFMKTLCWFPEMSKEVIMSLGAGVIISFELSKEGAGDCTCVLKKWSRAFQWSSHFSRQPHFSPFYSYGNWAISQPDTGLFSVSESQRPYFLIEAEDILCVVAAPLHLRGFHQIHEPFGLLHMWASSNWLCCSLTEVHLSFLLPNSKNASRSGVMWDLLDL